MNFNSFILLVSVMTACLYIGQTRADIKEFCASKSTPNPSDIDSQWNAFRGLFTDGSSLNKTCKKSLDSFRRDLKTATDQDQLCISQKEQLCELYKEYKLSYSHTRW